MRCYVCGRSPESFSEAHTEKRRLITEALEKAQEAYRSLKRELAESAGYSDDAKQAMRNLADDTRRLPVAAVIESEEYFIKREKQLARLLEYARSVLQIDRTRRQGYHNPRGVRTIGDIVDEFVQEPQLRTNSRLAEVDRDVRSLTTLLEETPEKVAFKKVARHEPPSITHKPERGKLRVNRVQLSGPVTKYVDSDQFNDKYAQGEPVVLCPTCDALFMNAAAAAHASDPRYWD